MAKNSPPVEDRRVELSDLCDDIIMEIFARLPVNKLLAVERVSKTWQRCVNAVLTEVKVVVFDNDSAIVRPEVIDPTCCHLQLARDNRQTLFVNNFSQHHFDCCYDKANAPLIRRLTQCPHVKCLDFSRCQILTDECFDYLTNAFPELECLNLGSVFLNGGQYYAVEWRRIFGELTSKLVHLKICSGFFSENKYFDLGFLLNGHRLREVHLSYSEYWNDRDYSLLDQFRNRQQIELSLDLDLFTSDYDFDGFSRLSFVVNKLTPTCRYLFKVIDKQHREVELKTLKVRQFSSDKSVVYNSLIIFKTLECLEMYNIKLDENTFKCRFERLETLHLNNTSAKDDAHFGLLFGSMQQLKKLIIRIFNWQPTHPYFPGQSLNVLKRLDTLHLIITCSTDDADFSKMFGSIEQLIELVVRIEKWRPTFQHLLYQSLTVFKCLEKFEFELAIENEEQIRMKELFDSLIKISSLKFIKIICNFNQFIIIPKAFKKEIIDNVNLWSLPLINAIKINLELRFKRPEFDKDAVDEVVEWYFLACQFEQIHKRCTEEKNVYKIQIFN